MKNVWRNGSVLLLALVIMPPCLAQDATDDGWKDTAELSFVLTAGNSESSTLGFKNTLSREWDRSLFTLKAGGVRVESTTTFRTAVGTPTNFVVNEQDFSETTAENYYLNGRYDRKITDRFFWYAGLGWDRNEFAGIKNRYIAQAGVGNIWFDTDDRKFRTDYALTFTDQEDVFQIPGADDSFVGLRFSWDYFNKLTKSAVYTNTLVVDENLDETSDWRADMINSLSVAMSERMALKVSLQWLYDNMPSFTSVPLFDNLGAALGSVPVELDELDTIFTASLVVNF